MTTKDNDTNELTMPDEPIFEITSLGEGLSLLSNKAVELTEQYAFNFLEQPEFIGERPFQDAHAIFLARQMEGGTFRWEQVNLIICAYAGHIYRMNGRHTCWARCEAKLSKDVRTSVRLLKYEAKTEQDMRELYASIDRGKARTTGNVVISYLYGRPEFAGYPRSLLRQLAEGLAMWQWESESQRKLHSGDERSYLLLADHHKTALHVGSFMRSLKGSEAWHINRGPTVAAMFATFGKAPHIAQGFWQTVYDGVGIVDTKDSRRQLRNYLMSTSLTKGRNAAKDGLSPGSQEDMYRACLLAWNAFRGNKPLASLRPARLESRPEPK